MRGLLFIYWKISIFAALCGGGLKFVAEVQFAGMLGLGRWLKL